MGNIIKFECHQCHLHYELDAEYAGAVAECSKCGTTFQIPHVQDEGDAELQLSLPYPPPPENTVRLQCCNCQATYELSTEFAGQVGECVECGAFFVIPAPDPAQPKATLPTRPYRAPAPAPVPKPKPEPETPEFQPEAAEEETSTPEALDDVPTNTVKLSKKRQSVGMIPQYDFKSSATRKKTVATYKVKCPYCKNIHDVDQEQQGRSFVCPICAREFPLPKVPGSNTAPPPPSPKQRAERRWWQFWKLFSRR